MKAYTECRESGEAWPGKLPTHWQAYPAAALFKEVKQKNADGAVQKELQFRYGSIIPKPQREYDEEALAVVKGYTVVEADDIVVNGINLNYDFVTQRVARVMSKGIITSAYLSLRTDARVMMPAYATYYLKSLDSKKIYHGIGKGIRKVMNYHAFRRLMVICPPLEEQQVIVSYLDSKSSAIDALVERREKVIVHLQELKQTIIAQAVIRGLNPDAPLKDSGAPWLGHVPAHWSTVQLRSLFAEHRKKNRGMQEKNLLSLSYGRIVAKDMEMAKGLVPRNYEGYNIVEADDIVLRLTDLQNDHKSLRTGLVTQRGIVTSAYLTLRKKAELNSAYMHYLLHVFDVKKAIYGMGNGVRQMINFGEMGRLSLLFPPIEEQASIVAYLDHKCVEIDALVARHRAMIERLKELKTSLIAAAVMGKIDVR